MISATRRPAPREARTRSLRAQRVENDGSVPESPAPSEAASLRGVPAAGTFLSIATQSGPLSEARDVAISKFGLGRKLLCVCLAFGLPIVVMWVLMTQAKLSEIRFAEKELAGDAFQRPLEEVLQHVGRHRRLWARGAAVAELETAEAAIDAALAHLDSVDREHGQTLQFTTQGLSLRGRGQFTAPALRRAWSGLRAELETLPSSSVEKAYDDIAAHVRTMITHAGDTSNLILDPDLDSYYLMDATLLALPQLEDRIQQIASAVDRFTRGQERAADAAQLGLLAAFLKQADWDRVAASIRTSFNEDPNFHGRSPSLEPSLGPHLESCQRKVTDVLGSLQALSATGGAQNFDFGRFRAQIDALDSAVYALHHAAFDEEDLLITRRLRDFERSLHWGFVLAAASVLVSALLAFTLSSHILRRLSRLSLATEAFAGGDLDARVGDAGGDEIGQLAGSFDLMTNRIGGLTAEVRRRAGELEQINGNLEKLVDDRTHELQKRNHAFRLILDNAHDGMLTVDLAGRISSERSVAVDRWFGAPQDGVTIGAYLAPDNATLAAELMLGLEAIQSDFLPIEVTLDQLPMRMTARGRHLRISYQPILESGSVSKLLVILADVTNEVASRQAAALQEDVLRMFQSCQRDRPGFLSFLMDARELMARIIAPCPPVELRRAIHTLKGNCGLFGVLVISKLCHEIENNLADNGDGISQNDSIRLDAAWTEVSEAITRVLGEEREGTLEVADAEYAAIVEAISSGAPRRDILEAIARWKLEPAERRLRRLGEQAAHLARRLGKDVRFSVKASGIRLPADTWSPVWSALSHAIRNAVDHGIESPEERIQRGVPRHGLLRLETRAVSEQLIIEIADDGRGIQWEALLRKAKAADLPHESQNDLVEALFADGISSCASITDTSGRGVGMGALRQVCKSLGGYVEIQSELLRGTVVRCVFPDAAAARGDSWAETATLPIQGSTAPPA